MAEYDELVVEQRIRAQPADARRHALAGQPVESRLGPVRLGVKDDGRLRRGRQAQPLRLTAVAPEGLCDFVRGSPSPAGAR